MKKGSKMTFEQKERLRIAHLGQIAWNRGLKGFKHSGSFKNGHDDLVPPSSRIEAGKKLTDEKHPLWKGDGVGYFALHSWVYRKLGKPTNCEFCKITNTRLELANISGKYKRNLDDWKYLCVKCHRKYDNHPFFLPRTDEQKRKQSERMKGAGNHFYGKKHKQETLLKMQFSKLKYHAK